MSVCLAGEAAILKLSWCVLGIGGEKNRWGPIVSQALRQTHDTLYLISSFQSCKVVFLETGK